jgi:hypothetical protein
VTGRRRRRPVEAPRSPCQPTGDFRPHVDNRVRTCTRCAEIVTRIANHDGTDWVVVDCLGSAFARNPVLELCPCYPLDSGLRTRAGRILDRAGSLPDGAEIDEKSRHYGPGLNLPDWTTHAHDDRGGEVYFTDLRSSYWACGHEPPAWTRVRTAPDSGPTLQSSPDWRPPPQCCGWPMRFAPRGWNCRVNTATWVVPDFGAGPGPVTTFPESKVT